MHTCTDNTPLSFIFISVTQRNCAVILYNLASNDDNCALMLEAGALIHIVHLTQAPLSATKMKCAAILSRLSLHAKHYDQFSKHDVLRVLLELCNVDNIMTQRRLVIAISNLSQVKSSCCSSFSSSSSSSSSFSFSCCSSSSFSSSSSSFSSASSSSSLPLFYLTYAHIFLVLVSF